MDIISTHTVLFERNDLWKVFFPYICGIEYIYITLDQITISIHRYIYVVLMYIYIESTEW